LQLSHDEFEDRRNSQALFEGALVWLGNKVALTKYAYNAFALVNVDQHPNLDIYRSATLAGHTNDKVISLSMTLFLIFITIFLLTRISWLWMKLLNTLQKNSLHWTSAVISLISLFIKPSVLR